MKRVKYGLIGFGGIAENRIAKEGFALDTTRFTPHKDAELVVAWDPNSDRASAAKALGIAWAESAESILRDKEIEAIVIASNNRTHAEWGKAALEAGKHILIEKPAGVTVGEVSTLYELAKKKNLSFGVDHMMTKNSYNIIARNLIRDKVIGDVESVVLHMEFPYGMVEEEARTWRCADPLELGGPIGDVGSHCFYMAEFLLDCKITGVSCVYTPKKLSFAVEDGAYIKFTTDVGVDGLARVAFDQKRGSLDGTMKNLGYEVYGTRGFIEGKGVMFQLSGHNDEPVKLSLSSCIDGVPEEHHPDEIPNIYASQISEHAHSILENKPLSGEDALRNLQLILLSHESAVEGGLEKRL